MSRETLTGEAVIQHRPLSDAWPRWNRRLFKKNLGHHALVFMVQQVAMKHRHAADRRTCEIYDHVNRTAIRNICRIKPLRVRQFYSVHRVDKKMHLMEMYGMQFL